MDTYIDAIVYEPTNKESEIVESAKDSSDSIAKTYYLFKCPKNLPRNLDQYSIDGSFKTNNIFDGPPTLTCKGVGEQKQLFLVHEGSDAC